MRTAHLAEDRHYVRIGVFLKHREDVRKGHAGDRLRPDVQNGADAEPRLRDHIGKRARLTAAAGDDADMTGNEMLVGEFDRPAQPAQRADPRGIDPDGARSQELGALHLAVGDHLEDIIQRNSFHRHHDPLDVRIQRLQHGVFQGRSGNEGHGNIKEPMVFHRILHRVVYRDSIHLFSAAPRRDTGNHIGSEAPHELGPHGPFPARDPLDHDFR